MVMTIRFLGGISPLRPYAVWWDEGFELHHTQAGGGPLAGEPLQGPYWVMRSEVWHYLGELKPVNVLGFSWRAAKWKISGRRMPFRMMANNGRIEFPKDPPPIIWLSRKSDALLMKLTLGNG
jgi:hypothetical protein